ncbi:MAG: hypothetical protein L7R83_00775 [Candidatus Poseidonia sp.]|nr:hypothetical protein [Poseidonia sp.]
MEEELVVQLTPETDSKTSGILPIRIIKEIWREITFGVGTWGALRPLVAALLAAVPFLFLGQHFNRQHRRGFEWSFLQVPLAFTVILWIGLYLWSIIDAWRDAVSFMGTASGPELISDSNATVG